MLIPVELDFRLDDMTMVINADTDKMEPRVADLLVERLEGRRPGPVILTGNDMEGVRRAFHSNILPGEDNFKGGKTLKVIQHSRSAR